MANLQSIAIGYCKLPFPRAAVSLCQSIPCAKESDRRYHVRGGLSMLSSRTVSRAVMTLPPYDRCAGFHKSGSAALTKERGPQDEPAQTPEAPDDSEDVHEDTSRRSSTCTTRRSSTCATTNL